MAIEFRAAGASDVDALVALINGAYRGDGSKRGWTSEADLLTGLRTDRDEIASLVADPDAVLLRCERDGTLIGCVLLRREDDRCAYLGMLVVDPGLQSAGIGKRIIEEAERLVQQRWDATRMRMTVLEQRPELLAFYERRGYLPTGRIEPWPDDTLSTPTVTGLRFVELEKPLR